MFTPLHLILPAPESGWEVWTCTPRGATKGGLFEDPATAAASVKKAIVALPARWCRTLAFSVPPADAKLARALAFTQLEKRGLTSGTIDQTSFSCQMRPGTKGGHLMVVDVLTPAALSARAAVNSHGVLPAAKLYPIPEHRVVILREGGRTVLHAGLAGQPAHVQGLTANSADPAALASEISLTLMTLRQQGLLSTITGIDWGAPLTESGRQQVEAIVGLPVDLKARPAPVFRSLDPDLQPAEVRAERQRRRGRLLRGAAIAALPLAGLLWWQQQHGRLLALEAEANRLSEAVTASSGATAEARAGTELMRGTQQRWQALRMALEPKRYPLIHLNHLTRCLGDDSIVLTRFETRGPDVSVSGTAQSAGEAYHYFTTVTADQDLKICAWSMAEPNLTNDGTARFELKGKMR